MRKRAVAPVLLSIAITSGCAVQNGEDLVTFPAVRTTTWTWAPPSTATPTPSATPSAMVTTSPPTTSPVTTTASPSASPTPSPTCDKPSKALLDWAAISISTDPGPVTASALVFASKTATGNWYVVAIDRALVRDDGTLAGGHSRALGLTDVVKRRSETSKLIALGGEVKGKLAVSWHNVSWEGATLAAGKRAVARAIACLDAAQSQPASPPATRTTDPGNLSGLAATGPRSRQ